MDTCGPCREQLLDFLYDLLEIPERNALEEHLDQCPVCRAALDQARGQQQLFATAARVEFPKVHFVAPRPEKVPPQPVVLPLRQRRPLPWKVVAAAAVVLFALGGLGVPGALIYRDYAAARDIADAGRVAVADARQKLKEVDTEYIHEAEEHKERLAEVKQTAADRGIKVKVSGHETIQPGAPNRYTIQTTNLAEKLVPVDLTVRVRDQNQVVLHEEKNIAGNGTYQVELPANLPVKSDTQLSLEVLARRSDGLQGHVEEQLSLAAPVFVTHLATDKPIYHPGDTVRFRSLTLERFSLKPPEQNFQLEFLLTMPGDKTVVIDRGLSLVANGEGEQVLKAGDGQPLRGIGGGEFRLDESLDGKLPGGEYTLIVREVQGRFLEQQRKFLVNNFQTPRLHKELEWDKKSYGPADEVYARGRVSRMEGGEALADKLVEAGILVDGKLHDLDGREITNGKRNQLKTDAKGLVDLRFKLPPQIKQSEAALSLLFDDGESPETLIKPIPLVLQTLQVDFYPEGGELVAGVANKVYFQALNGRGKPAEMRARIVDGEGKIVKDAIETFAVPDQPGAGLGMGYFDFTPAADKTYALQIESPIGVQGQHFLPKVVEDGVVMHVLGGVTSPTEPIRVQVVSPRADRNLLVGAYCRGRLMDHKSISVKKGSEAVVELLPTPSVGGVYRITVFEERETDGQRRELLPKAERLVYRLPEQRLDLFVEADKAHYLPGESVKLTLKSETEKGEPTPAVLLVAVVDRGVISLADEKAARSMTTHFFLTTEVRKPDDLEHADFLLSPHPRAKDALDLLLGTQGWRRFAEQNPDDFREKFKEDADRLLVTIGQAEERTFDRFQEELKSLRRRYNAGADALDDKRTEAEDGWRQAHDDPKLAEAAATVARYEQGARTLFRVGMPLLGGLLLMAGLAVMLRVVPREWRAVRPVGIALLGCAAVLMAVVVVHVANQPKEAEIVAQEMAPLDPEIAGKSRPNQDWDQPALSDSETRGKDLNEIHSGKTDRRNQQGDKATEGKGDAPEPAKPTMISPQAGGRGTGDGKPGDLKQSYGKRPDPTSPNLQTKPGSDPKDRALGGVMDETKKNLPFTETALKQQQGQQPRPPQPKGTPDAARDKEAEDKLRKKVKELDSFRYAAPFDKDGSATKRKTEEEQAKEGFRKSGPFVVREYAFGSDGLLEKGAFGGMSAAPQTAATTATGDLSGRRFDFTETLFWNPVVLLPNGRAQVQFRLCDSVTTFQVAVMGHSLNGRIGATTTHIESRLPFSLETKVPAEVGSGDKIDVPVTIVNNSPQERQVVVTAEAEGLTPRGEKALQKATVPADQRTRQVFPFEPNVIRGEARLDLFGQTQTYAADHVQRKLTIVPDGFPASGYRSDLLNGAARHGVELPETLIDGTLELKAEIFPSPLADLQKGLEGLLGEPNGSFEQTSTVNYPNLLILDFLKESGQANPEVEQRSRDLLVRGYRQMMAFECPYTDQPKHGFEWFGEPDNAHEALTAFGLMQFRELARVQSVDPALLERTKQFLLARRDAKGGFQRNLGVLNGLGRAPEPITNAYIVWALTESGKDDVTRELNALADQAKAKSAPKDSYIVALVANSLLNRDRAEEAVALLKTLTAAQKDDGYVDGAKTSITSSAGRDLQIETTALTVLGWLKANRPAQFGEPIRKAVRWIGQQRSGSGSFGSTQSTILALKALIAHAKVNKKTATAGELKLYVGDVLVGSQGFAAGVLEVVGITLPDAGKHLKAGQNAVRVEMTGANNVFPHTLSWSYRTLKPMNADNVPVKLTTKLDRDTATEGATVRLTATVENVSGQAEGMTVAIVGLPAGLALPEDLAQLRKHTEPRIEGKDSGLIGFFEVRGRELVLYWRGLAAGQKIEVPVDLICRVPGEYRGPASRAYPYYNADAKHWVEPLRMSIR